MHNMFVFIGADPATHWLKDCGVLLDRNGFVRTGPSLAAGRTRNECPAADALESDVFGVFAVGDVRCGSVKRVGGAIGEGAAVVRGTALLPSGYTGCTAVRPREAEHLRKALRAKRVACGGGPIEKADGKIDARYEHEPASRHAAGLTLLDCLVVALASCKVCDWRTAMKQSLHCRVVALTEFWGVLDRLCQERQLKIAAISGASSGAFNAAVYLYGLASGGAEGAREALETFWTNVAKQALWSGNPFIGASFFGAFRNIDNHPLSIWIEQLAPIISPYNLPFLANSLEPVARTVMKDPEKLKHPEPAVFFDLVDVVNGRREIVTQPNITIPSLLASACLPTSSRAIRIGRGLYWDGGYMGNPALAPLVRLARDNEGVRDILMVTVNPFRRTDLMPPQSGMDIQDRLNEIIFNSSLVLEINGIHTVNNLLRQCTEQPPLRAHDNRPLREILFHRISDDGYMRMLGYVSKVNPSLLFLEEKLVTTAERRPRLGCERA